MGHGVGSGWLISALSPRIFDATPLRQAESSRLVGEAEYGYSGAPAAIYNYRLIATRFVGRDNASLGGF
jgi:hypothetical protein